MLFRYKEQSNLRLTLKPDDQDSDTEWPLLHEAYQFLLACQVCNSPGNFENPIVCPGAQTHFGHCLLKNFSGGICKLCVSFQLLAVHS